MEQYITQLPVRQKIISKVNQHFLKTKGEGIMEYRIVIYIFVYVCNATIVTWLSFEYHCVEWIPLRAFDSMSWAQTTVE